MPPGSRAPSPARPAPSLLPRWRGRWLLALCMFFLSMLALGGVPGEADAWSARFGDKLLHALAYGFMALLCFRATIAPPALRALLSTAIVALLGLADESLQSLLPYRNASLWDWCFDVGAAAAVAALLLLHAHLVQPAKPDAQENP